MHNISNIINIVMHAAYNIKKNKKRDSRGDLFNN
jgi:hypothetical protein